MAARYTFADFAVKAIEYAELEKSYNAHGGVRRIERQAMNFADQVRTHFEALGDTMENDLPGETAEAREEFRQKKIREGVVYASNLIGATNLSEQAKEKILGDLETYLDTTVYDPSRPSMMRKWDRLGRGYAPAVRGMIKKHVDVYQKRKARNHSLIRSVASLSTFGLESYVVSRAMSAKASLESNYTQQLTELSAEQRTGVERMRAFGRGVKEAMASMLMTDNFRETRAAVANVDILVETLISEDQESATNELFDVDGLTASLLEKYQSELTAKGLDEAWLYDQVETIAERELLSRRKEVAYLLKTRILDLHKKQIRSVAQQAGHLYNQYNVNITALSILGNVDMAIEEVTRVRSSIGVVLEHASGGRIDPSVVTVDQDLFEQLPTEPQVALAMHSSRALLDVIGGARAETQVAIEAAVSVPVDEIEIEFAELDEIPEESQVDVDPTLGFVENAQGVATVEYIVQGGDTLWGIARDNLSMYQIREQDFTLSIPGAVALIQRDNDMSNSTLIIPGETVLSIPGLTGEYIDEAEVDPFDIDEEDAQELRSDARSVDRGERPEGYLPLVDRGDLHDLPQGTYRLVFGERHGKADGRMPVYYSNVVRLEVDADGFATVLNVKDSRISTMDLDEFMAREQRPIIRVFQVEGDPVQVETETFEPEQWSQRNQALARFMQENPVSNVKAGEYCSKFAAGQLNYFDSELAASLGFSLRDAKGDISGVVVHAPMWEAGAESVGGRSYASLSEYFDHDRSDTRPIMRLENGDAEYRESVGEWIKEARVPLRQATAQYEYTKIRGYIDRNEDLGGSENYHVINLYGDKDLVSDVVRDTTLARHLAREYDVYGDDLSQRGWLFEELGIEVNGNVVTNQEDWETMTLQQGDEVVVHDIAINHRYGGNVADSLVTMMVRKGTYTPVEIVEGNAGVVNESLAFHGEGGDYAVDTFHVVEAGDTMAKIFEQQNFPRDLWMAAVYAMRADGYVDPDHIRPGELVHIYDAETLRANIEDIYALEERKMAVATDNPDLHLVRPGETMNEVSARYFDRSRYSTEEWGQIRGMLAERTPLVTTREVQMPGSEYVPPYTTTEYSLRADDVLEYTNDDLASIDRVITDQRLEARVYLPDTMPIRTADGVVEETLDAEVRWLIDGAIDRNPEYGEAERAALALVYANEGMREVADKTYGSQAIAWVRDNVAEPYENMSEHVAQMIIDKAGIDVQAGDIGLVAAMDITIETVEYLWFSRQMAKDIAWAIHDSPMAAAALDKAIALGELGIQSHRATDAMHQVGLGADIIDTYNDVVAAPIDEALGKVVGKLETVEGISSAGLFQVRAFNLIEENGERNSTEEVLGRRMSFDELETELRADPVLNTEVAAHILHENRVVIDTYLSAFGDPLADSEDAKILAVANSYNGGPEKTMVGAVQVGLMDMAVELDVDNLAVQNATGRGKLETQGAFVQICLQLAKEGRIERTEDEIMADALLLEGNTIAFLRSETMQQFKGAYADMRGTQFTLLPNMDRLSLSDVSYANYAYLANRGGALNAIEDNSRLVRSVVEEQDPSVAAKEYIVSGNKLGGEV